VWTVDAAPLVRIGSVGGSEATQFNALVAAALSNDGDIVVGYGEPPEIRIFSPTGTFRARHGRAGVGPGEFQNFGSLFVGAGDTVFAVNQVFEPSVHSFSLRTGFLSSLSLPREQVARALPNGWRRAEGVQGIFADGAMVVAADQGSRVDHDRTPSGEVFRPASTAIWISADRTRNKVLGAVPELEQIFVNTGSGGRTIVIPLGARMALHGMSGQHPARFCYTTNNGPEVQCVDSGGEQLIIRWPQKPSPISREEAQAWQERTRAGYTQSGLAQRIIDVAQPHDSHPPILHVHVAADRSVLVMSADFSTVQDTVMRYRVFSPQGELLGKITFPPRFELAYVTGNRAVGVVRDEQDVQHVVVHKLTRRVQ
jgi:hypothetical protein